MRSFAIALIVSVTAGFATAADVENPFKNAKVGDKLSYKMSVKTAAGSFDGTMTQEVTEKTDKEVTVKTTTKMLGKEQPPNSQKIDLTKAFDPSAMGGKGGKVEKLKDGTEKVKVGDKEYDCNWTSYKVSPPAGAPAGFAPDTELKVWLNKDVPGMVKMNIVTKIMNQETNVVMELTEIAKK